MTSIPTCCVTGKIAGDREACGDCDPCILGAPSVPTPVKLLMADRDALCDDIERHIGICGEQQEEIERLRAALESLTKDPPATLAREPDEDCEVIIKMRAIARAALEHSAERKEK